MGLWHVGHAEVDRILVWKFDREADCKTVAIASCGHRAPERASDQRPAHAVDADAALAVIAVGQCSEKPWKIIERELAHSSAKRLLQNRFGTSLGSASEMSPVGAFCCFAIGSCWKRPCRLRCLLVTVLVDGSNPEFRCWTCCVARMGSDGAGEACRHSDRAPSSLASSLPHPPIAPTYEHGEVRCTDDVVLFKWTIAPVCRDRRQTATISGRWLSETKGRSHPYLQAADAGRVTVNHSASVSAVFG